MQNEKAQERAKEEWIAEEESTNCCDKKEEKGIG